MGLAAPGEVGSWQTQSKVNFNLYLLFKLWLEEKFYKISMFSCCNSIFQGYQFWARADTFGSFMIKNVRAGVYNLYAWVPGIVGDYKYDVKITVSPGIYEAIVNLVIF